MPKFAANLSTLFGEVPFLDRFAAASEAGFRAIEFQFPYAFDRDPLAERAAAHKLTVELHNLPPGEFDAGERGIACLPDRIAEFQDSVGVALDYAKALGCRRLNCLAGIPPAGLDRERARRALVDNLRFAARALENAGVKLLVEPINPIDMPGFFVNRSADFVALAEEVGEKNLWLQYDVYHMQRVEGELAATFERLLPRIAHVQIADNPGRHEPGTGEINFEYLFRRFDALGYDGWIGCEYRPAGDTVEGLAWLRRFAPSVLGSGGAER